MEDVVSQPKIQEAVSSVTQTFGQALQELIQGNPDSMRQVLQAYVGPAFVALGMVVLAYFVAKFVSRIAAAPVCKRVDETLGKFVGKLVFNSIIAGTLLGVLGKFGVDVTSFAAVLGAMGFAIGLAFQGTLSNFAAGILLLVFRPFKVGDVVVTGGVSGKVNEIDLFTTTIDTPDNRRIIVPNSAISGSVIENVSHHQHRRFEVTIGLAYDCSIDTTRAALTAALESIRPLLVDGPDRSPSVGLHQFSPNAIEWQVKCWAKAADCGPAKEALLISIKEHLDQYGLRIPFPQLEVHLPARQDSDRFHEPSKGRIRPERVA